MRLPRAPGWALLLAALFAFRLWFGLSREFFFEDETQIFLIGFRYYATGEWPYFGPDVVWTKSEIPGALQGVLVGLPLRAAPYPESPYVALAILSFGALCLFAWYVGAHHPDVPRWLIWGWLFTIPWTIQFSLHLINTSYILPAALVFFVGVFESLPALSFASLEINRFVATDAPKRLEFFQRHLWLAPLAIVVGVAGVVQPLWMFVDWARPARWREAPTRRRWNAVRLFLAGAVLLVYASYFFVVEPAQAHAFYVLAPIAFLFAAYWWRLVDSPRARQVAAALLALGILYHAGLAWAQAPELP